jgi:type IV pilus assembly protein PilA
MGFDLMGRVGLISLIALIGLSAAMPATASELAKKNKAAATEALQVTGMMVRGQQAYYLEESIFAKNFKEIGGSKDETPHYRYRIFPSSKSDTYVMVGAVPKRQGLPTYLGLVNVEKVGQEWTTYGMVCRSTQAKAITPNWSMIAKPKPQSGFVCPAGFKGVR